MGSSQVLLPDEASHRKKIMITQSNYIPWKGYFDSINTVDEFVLYDDMQYTRGDWRNRNHIKTSSGLLWLTIPVEVKGKFYQTIRDTKISNKNWGKEHWTTIKHCYSKAQHFNELKDIFEPLYLMTTTAYLSEINFTFIKAIGEILGITTQYKWSSDFILKEDRVDRLVSICSTEGATDYYTGPAARDYIREEAFSTQNISVNYFDYSGYPPYKQLYGDFVHSVSILDLLFNEGKNAKAFMKSFKGVAYE
jgi:hypothetical protein